jgi:uncharacterized membrane protein
MIQRADSTSCYDEMPFSLVLFRYLWPFWLFKDASSGDRMTRAAAYRHNRDMRFYLPGYMLKWMFSSVVAYAFLSGAETLASYRESGWHLFTWLAGAGAIAFVASLCVLFVTGYIYLYLNRHEG